MNEWWGELSMLNRAMFGAAAFFSVLFLWQLISAVFGLTDDAPDIDDFDGDVSADAADTVEAFKLLGVRSIITFFTLFTWGSALYLNSGESPASAMGISTIWGLIGMVSVSFVLYILPKLAHTGTKNLDSCIGTPGTVYLDIPEHGAGEVKVTVTGVVSHVKARAVDGAAIKSSTPVVVVRRLGQNMLEVKPV